MIWQSEAIDNKGLDCHAWFAPLTKLAMTDVVVMVSNMKQCHNLPSVIARRSANDDVAIQATGNNTLDCRVALAPRNDDGVGRCSEGDLETGWWCADKAP